ncbi:hypothetical protein [Paenibacillus sp. FSL E2-0178]|uniref:hypothetical protein n=1 Tax=Paenibacillus sp. FSL E2-0178 TaxID=2921361 RepID=UPI003158720D
MSSSFDWYGTGISALISLGLSLVTFSLGVRSGKERTERLKLREKYREIFAHFNKLKEGVENYKPISWDKFYDSKTRESKPYCRELVKNGESLELSRSLFPKVVDLEEKTLGFGWKFTELSESAGDIVIDVLERRGVSLKKEQYRTIVDFEEGNNERASYYELNPVLLMSEEKRNEWNQTLETSEAGINFTYLYESKIKYSIYLKKSDLIRIGLPDLINQIGERIYNENLELIEEQKALIAELKTVLKKVSKLAKEPHSFWGTIGNTFRDFFR